MRSAAGQASSGATTAADTGAGLGASADGISANLLPFLTQELTHPQGYSQQDTTQQLNAAEAGAGGATSGITGQADLMSARSRNPSGFTAALGDAARTRDKAAAGASEGIATKNADLKQTQQQSAAKDLGGMYGEDTDAMLKSMGIQTGDINAEVNADKTGWLQNATGILSALGGGASGAGSLIKAIK